jgi:anthranilate phosphoribosyltransferase
LPDFGSFGGWPGVLGRLAAGEALSSDETAAALGEVLAGDASGAQIAAFMFGLRCKGETAEELRGLVAAMLGAAERIAVPDALVGRLVDTCGTGGDRSGTINVSTIAALVLAGAGVPVCKHGGRAASSRAGSADLLEALGVRIELPPAGVVHCIEEAGIGFCFAPRYHPAMRHAAPTRRDLGVPTAFNLVGPLANPARVTRQVVGVGDASMASRMAEVLVATGLSTAVSWRAEDPVLRTTSVDPQALGLARAAPGDLLGGDAATNASMARTVLAGNRGAHRDIVALNAAAGLVVAGVADDLADGLARATESIDSGAAAAALDRLVAASHEGLDL